MKKEKDCFESKEYYCKYSPTSHCSNRTDLMKCIHEKRCIIVPERPFERKIIKK